MHWPQFFLFLALAGHAVFWICAGPLGLARAGFRFWRPSRAGSREVLHRAVRGGCLRTRGRFCMVR